MTQTLEFSITFEVPAKVIYNALTDKFELSKFTRTLAQFDAVSGGEFKLYEGKIVGKNLELEEGKLIKQEWKFSEWPDFSVVTIKFQDKEDACKVTLHQEKVPKSESLDKLEQGWKSHIFLPMSKICGYPIEDE